jgi:hypothetical protein
MSRAARAAAVRGDNYQYAVGWLHAADALSDPGVESVSIEDAGAGQFDDLVVRRRDTRPDRYWQVKSSNSGNVSIDEEWLTTSSTAAGQSPLQHFHATWTRLRETERPFELILITNRGFDDQHALLGPLRDNYTGHIRVAELEKKGDQSRAGQARRAWSSHLGIDNDELIGFLAVVKWEQAGPEVKWREDAKRAMRLAGLRDDDTAVEVGLAIVREWVMIGAGPRSVDDIRRVVNDRNLLADSAQLVLAIHAIDRPASAQSANVTVDWVDRFEAGDATRRYQVADPSDWTDTFPVELDRARASLEAFTSRRVLVTGAMRQAMHFAVGHALPDVRRWVLTVNQRGHLWSTDAPPEDGVQARVLERLHFNAGSDYAVAVALANDVTADVKSYIATEHLPVSEILVLGPDDMPGGATVPTNEWLVAWVRSARDIVRAATKTASHIHLFLSGPASAALMLGHQWNTLAAPTIVYEFNQRTYFPTFHVP